MHTDRIAELLEPFLTACAALSSAQLRDISTYIDILLRWNARINLTAIRDPEEIVTRHFGESLFAARHLFPDAPTVRATNEASAPALSEASVPSVSSVVNDLACTTVADIGSGAGFPGIPVKLWAPHIALTLIESNHKKSTFLRELVRTLTLTDVNVFPGRAETLAPNAAFDVVILRAVERFGSALPIAASLVVPGGRLALLIGSAQLGLTRATLPDFSWQDPFAIPGTRSRVLVVGTRPR